MYQYSLFEQRRMLGRRKLYNIVFFIYTTAQPNRFLIILVILKQQFENCLNLSRVSLKKTSWSWFITFFRTSVCGLIRHWPIRPVLLPRDGSRVHQLWQERVFAGCARLQTRHRWQEHPQPKLGNLPQGKTQLFHPWRVPILLQRNT